MDVWCAKERKREKSKSHSTQWATDIQYTNIVSWMKALHSQLLNIYTVFSYSSSNNSWLVDADGWNWTCLFRGGEYICWKGDLHNKPFNYSLRYYFFFVSTVVSLLVNCLGFMLWNMYVHIRQYLIKSLSIHSFIQSTRCFSLHWLLKFLEFLLFCAWCVPSFSTLSFLFDKN